MVPCRFPPQSYTMAEPADSEQPPLNLSVGGNAIKHASEQGRNKFEFINLTQQPRHHPRDQSMIRSHAMKKFHQTKEGLEATIEDDRKLTLDSGTLGKAQHRFRLYPRGLQDRDIKPRKLKARDNRSEQGGRKSYGLSNQYSSDISKMSSETLALYLLRAPLPIVVVPYSPTPEVADKRVQKLMHHYQNVFSKQLIVVGPRQDWLPFACGDTAQFHATMFMAVAHIAHLQQSTAYPQDFYFHRWKAIHTVNERLEEGVEVAATDGTINAICCFANIENLNAQPRAAKIHMDALFKLVEAAGGIEALGMNGLTRRLVLWIDLATAIMLVQKPRFNSLLLNCDMATYFGISTPSTRSFTRAFTTRLEEFTDLRVLSEQAGNVFWALRNLSEFLQASSAKKDILDSTNPNDIQFCDRVEMLERLLHPLWYVGDQGTPHSSIFRLFGWTSLIYTYVVFRQVPGNMLIFQLLARRVKVEMENCGDLDILFGKFPDLIQWALLLCRSKASISERPFFAMHLGKFLLLDKIVDEDVTAALASQMFFWPENRNYDR
ncbi:hypothetical protein V502_10347 [Pseudogymnoascus sp. VKM F-4520 (FW-2644)]|nr:hypothetical protein V502_10347 [Pseudogymnoascus sp. VKM F-4520 (FW-2644)]